MTSQINPANINGEYPVAGQPNSTEGMRSNFTNTKTNFQFAADEITELQTKGVFKSALTGTTLDNNMNDNIIYAVKLQDVSYTWLQNTTTSGTIVVDYSAGQYQYITTTGSISLDFTNWPDSGSAGSIELAIYITNSAHTLTLPYNVQIGRAGIQGLSAGTITFTSSGVYYFRFTTTNGGVYDPSQPGDTGVSIFDLTRPLLNTRSSFMGYTTGESAGGTVTQSTDKSTGVTLNKRCGQITMNNASLAAGAEVSFTLTNSLIAATDVVYACIASGATAGAYNLQVDAIGSGSCRISLGNMSSGALGEAIVINFILIKSAAN